MTTLVAAYVWIFASLFLLGMLRQAEKFKPHPDFAKVFVAFTLWPIMLPYMLGQLLIAIWEDRKD